MPYLDSQFAIVPETTQFIQGRTPNQAQYTEQIHLVRVILQVKAYHYGLLQSCGGTNRLQFVLTLGEYSKVD